MFFEKNCNSEDNNVGLNQGSNPKPPALLTGSLPTKQSGWLHSSPVIVKVSLAQ